MASPSFLALAVCFLALANVSFSQLESQEQQQQHRLRAKSSCNIQRITAREPNRRVEAEAGTVEIWDQNEEEFQCAGVAAIRYTIQPKGLVLPSYANAPKLTYIVQGRGIEGTLIPGCPETFESESQQSTGQQGQQSGRERHQKIRQFREGDVLAAPAGVASWAYNDGETPITAVSLIDTSNDANQLDRNLRKFFLAGNPQRGQQQQESGNVFSGFDEQLLAEVFGVSLETARKLQGRQDQRGPIVRAEGLQFISPQRIEEQEREQRGQGPNGLEETLCTMRLSDNIGNPGRADVYNPRGGRISSLNSQKLPVLRLIKLSAERVVLYRNAMLAPLWNINAHSIVYVIRGSARIQIVNNAGQLVFNDQVRQGQIIIVPQNFVVLKKAGDQGCDLVSFKTNDNAMTSPLAGRTSAFRAMPAELMASAYRISQEEAKNLKYRRQELTVFGPRSRSGVSGDELGLMNEF